MIRLFRLTLFACALFASPIVAASTKTTDITDMWWIPTESGWGVTS